MISDNILPGLGAVAKGILRRLKPRLSFKDSEQYWNQRYALGGDSGVGSYGPFAEFKAEVVNRLVAEQRIQSVIEFGCGDGNQLSLAKYPAYVGFDVSPRALAMCQARFRGDAAKQFRLLKEYRGERAEMALSLDVIFHLVEEEVFREYMERLFASAVRMVVLYSSNFEGPEEHGARHVRHRKFTDWIDTHASEFSLLEHVPNRYPYRGDYHSGSFADFYIYSRC